MLRNFSILLFLHFLFLCNQSVGQIASSAEVQEEFNKGVEYYRKAQLDSAAIYFEKARNLAYETKGASFWKGQTTHFLSLAYIESDTARSNELFREAVENTKKLAKYNGAVANFYSDRAGVFQSRGNRAEALRYYRQALEYIKPRLEDRGDSNSLMIILRDVVEFHLEVRDTQSALAELAASPLPEGTPNYEPYQSYGDVYSELGQHEEALAFYFKALEHQKADMRFQLEFGDEDDIKDLPTDTLALGYRMNSVAEAYLNMGQLILAKTYLDSVEIYFNGKYDDLTLAANDRAVLALRNEDFKAAEKWLNRVAEGLNDINAEAEWQQFFTSQEELAAALNQFDQYKYWRTKKDSLDKKVLEDGRIAILNTQRDIERQQEAELRKAQDDTIAQSRTINLLGGGVLIIAFALVYYFAVTSKKMRALSNRNELLVREQNHRVKNNLQMINSLLSLQAGRLKDEQSKDVLKSSQTRIQAISLLNRSLYEQKDISHVDIKAYIEELSQDVINSVTDQKVNARVNVASLEVNIDKATSLGLIINELIVNSIKHANGQQVGFELNLSKVNDQLLLHYKDQNDGFELANYKSSRSFGKRLIELQSRQLKGELELIDSSQFELKLVFPL